MSKGFGVVIGIGAALAAFIVVALRVAGSRGARASGTDVGHVSENWVAEHRAGTQYDRFS